MKKTVLLILVLLLLLGVCAVATAEEYYYNDDVCFEYWMNDDQSVSIMFSKDTSGKTLRDGVIPLDLVIPAEIDGHPVTEIAFHAFSGLEMSCYQIHSITLPPSVLWVDDAAGPFDRCNALEKIVVEEGNLVYEAKDGVLFNKVTNTLVCMPKKHAAVEYFIPEGMAAAAPFSILSDALRILHVPDSVTLFEDALNCPYLEVLHVGSGVERFTKVDDKTGIAQFPFSDFRNLREIHVSAENPYFSSQDGILFDKAGTTLLYYPWPRNTNRYDIPETVTAIDKNAFSHRGIQKHPLEYISIPDSFTFENGEERSTYFYPLAMTDEAMQSLALKGPNKKKVESNYVQVDPSDYNAKLDPDFLESRFPALKEGKILWIVRKTAYQEELNEKTQANLEQVFISAGITKDRISANPILAADGNVWSNDYPYTVVCPQIAGQPFPHSSILLVKEGSLAEQWAVQNGYMVRYK